MLRGRAVAAALCVLVPAARADLFGQDEDLCARVDADHSNMWEDQAHGLRTMFDLHVQYPLSEGVDFIGRSITLQWDVALTFEAVDPQGAVIATAHGSDYITVETTPAFVGHEYFSVRGYHSGATRRSRRRTSRAAAAPTCRRRRRRTRPSATSARCTHRTRSARRTRRAPTR